ncbi:hypothetical protein I3760_02G119300 [Carya illinoinensis]|nr:hypothetical protein I3760_02G119300 [Carya illinoinensis]
MSSFSLASLEPLQSLLHARPTLSKPINRWRTAFVTIYCSRALLSFYKNSLTHKKNTVVSRHSSFFVVDLKLDNNSKIDQTTLNDLVKEKNVGGLKNIGGIRGVASNLETDVEFGIRADSFFHFVVEAFKDLTIFILLGCASLSLAFGIKQHGIKEGWYDGGSIFVAIFLVIAVSAISNFKQNRQFDKLSKVSNNIQVEVVRAGRRQQISVFDIVVGDVVCLKIGDQVPADGLFLDGHSLQVDESSMTGESEHVEVNCSHPFLVSGTKVADGYARMLVTSVGMNTTWGEMMSSINRDTNEQTPLQARLNKLTSSIGKVGLAVAFLVLVVLLVRYFTGKTEDENGNREFNGSKTKADDVVNAVVAIVATAVTIIVVAIPEGLPLAVTLTLAYSMKRMMADQAMVRKLSACETMGSATTICTDKTGTLTMNLMKVTQFWLGEESFATDVHSSIAPCILDLVHEGVALNTTGSVYRPPLGFEIEFSGSPTEKAILSWSVLELNMEMEQMKESCTILFVEAFNSQKKRSGALMRRKVDNTTHMHWKGAAEMILQMCSSYYDASGNIKDIDDGKMLKFEQIIQGMAASSLRCIAFTHKQISEEDNEDGEEHKKLKEDGLTLLGLVGLKDPCRPGAMQAVEDCQNAGVNIKMITGDNVFTAKAIATECGILRPGQDMYSGAVRRAGESENICVMARSSPFDKLLMVECLKQKGHVVAVTGDGTNDAPALKEANIGLSMGIQGTEVAKESSDMCVYNNIQKFIQFQLTVNVAALVINFVAAVSAGEVPLTAVQLLWVNLIMDTLGALALATEKPTKELMEKPSVGWTEPLITNIMWRNLLAQALYQIAILLILQFRGESIFGVTAKVNDTLIFNTFVLCQVFNEFNARKLEKKNVFKGIHRNRLFLGIIAITIVLQVVMVEFLKKFADTERLNWVQWSACIGVAAISWPIGWFVKWIPVPERPLFSYLKMKKKQGLPLKFSHLF